MNANGRGPVLTQEKAASLERLARARLFAYSQKRTMPPRINPMGIMLLILTAGIIFIGLTITIVANWPGLASVGENRLKIAGPVILGVGFVGCLATAAALCWWVSRQNLKWEADMTETARKYISSSQSQEPLTDVPNYHGKPRRPGEHAMVVAHPGRKGDPSSPDPSASSFESRDRYADDLPNPIRLQKKRTSSGSRQQQQLNTSNGSSNLSFSAGEGDMSIPGFSFGSSPRGSTQPTGGFVRSPRDAGSPAYGNDNEIERYTRHVKTTTTTMTTTKATKKSKRGDQGQADPIRGAVARGMAGYARPDAGLRLVIRADQRTAVHITPSTTPTTGGHPTGVSMNTEI